MRPTVYGRRFVHGGGASEEGKNQFGAAHGNPSLRPARKHEEPVKKKRRVDGLRATAHAPTVIFP